MAYVADREAARGFRHDWYVQWAHQRYQFLQPGAVHEYARQNYLNRSFISLKKPDRKGFPPKK
jgi:hypothetical protein